jgi:hypothetical protein
LTRPILFLDFDGVLHPVDCHPDHHFCRLPLLAGWLKDERPDVDLVISPLESTLPVVRTAPADHGPPA